MANMKNNLDSSVAATPDVVTDITGGAFVGSALQLGREAKNMTVEEAARQLRLGTRQILALEQDDFAKLPDAMITRGFIRNYARLLGMDAEPLLQAYRAKMPDKGQARLTLTSERIVIKNTRKKSYLAYLLIGLVLMLGLAAWWLYTDESKAKIASMAGQVMDENVATQTTQAATEALPPQALPAAERLTEASSAITPPAVAGAAMQAPATATAEMATPQLTTEIVMPNMPTPGNETMQFKGIAETWVQVQNMAGNVIYEHMIAAGAVESFGFKPPAKVVVGNAAGVQLLYKNQPVDLLSHAKNNVARLTLE